MIDDKFRRIDQNTERLLTVRPRYQGLLDTYSNVATIRFRLPEDADIAYMRSQVSSYEAVILDKLVSDDGYVDFILQSMSYDIQEKSQIVQAFGGESMVYFYGQAPVVLSISGLLVDDLDNDHFIKFLTMYRKFISGTAAAKNYGYVELTTHNSQWIGAFMGVQVSNQSDRDTDVQFNATMIAKEFTLVPFQDTIEGDIETVSLGHRPADPTVTASAVESLRRYSAEDRVNLLNNPYAIKLGSLPTIGSAIGFSAADLTSFFSFTTDVISAATGLITDLVGYVGDYGEEIAAYLDAVEFGLDAALRTVDNATRNVYGTLANLESLVIRTQNFPETLANRIKYRGNPTVLGSKSVPQTSAAKSVRQLSLQGSLRGIASLSQVSTKERDILNSLTIVSLSNIVARLNATISSGSVSVVLKSDGSVRVGG